MSTGDAPGFFFGSASIYWDTTVSSLLYPVLSDKELWAAWKHKAKSKLHLKFPSWNMWYIKVHIEGHEHLDRRHCDLTVWKSAATGRKLTNEQHGFHIRLKSNRTFPLCWMPSYTRNKSAGCPHSSFSLRSQRAGSCHFIQKEKFYHEAAHFLRESKILYNSRQKSKLFIHFNERFLFKNICLSPKAAPIEKKYALWHQPNLSLNSKSTTY